MSQSDHKLQTLKGFRDFLPGEKRKREFVIRTIEKVFERHGFDPIETPTLEYASVLQGKYGTEADQLMYTFEDRGKRMVGLRYDQTVPTARFLSQHQHNLPKYFRRYQVQHVFRAENTQKGRYREFVQCDCDLFGTTDPIADAEILAVFYRAYTELGICTFQIKVNDRTTLFETLTPYETDTVDVFSIIQSVDKLEKIEVQGVVDELIKKGLTQEKASELLDTIMSIEMPLALQKIIEHAVSLGVPHEALVYEPTLARGLDYYTGLIFEGTIPRYSTGSVGGGGRYDKLIENLGGPSVPAVGFAIGFDRTVEALEAMDLMPDMSASSEVLATVFSEEYSGHTLEVVSELREAGISVEVYPSHDKVGKQLKYADDQNIPFVIIMGPDEIKDHVIALKHLTTGYEMKGDVEEITEKILSHRRKKVE